MFVTVTTVARIYSYFAICAGAALKAAPFSTSCSTQALNINLNREPQLMRARAARRLFVFPLPHLLYICLTTDVEIVAGVISLLNDYRVSKGKSPRGWLNPWLYCTPAAARGTTDV